MSDEYWQYWELDPIDLDDNEIEYELRLRGMANVMNPRVKTRVLRGLLASEQKNMDERTHQWPSPLHISSDINLCEQSCDSIASAIMDPTQTEATVRKCWSRLLHLFSRVQRIKTTNPVLE